MVGSIPHAIEHMVCIMMSMVLHRQVYYYSQIVCMFVVYFVAGLSDGANACLHSQLYTN